ncbi:MAG: threonine synthase [Chloroflexi bacterium]|nr:MAG: threonine synthase [Chloroflexota bacterium]MBL1193887.1 threonine synthase [Chloroflexota bacterium]NOH11181.1 threonine synthase [Chloroflexota bacterium]
MNKAIGYQCSICDKTYGLDEVTYTCPDDGGNLSVVLDYDGIKATTSPADIQASSSQSIWRYLPLLPVGEPGHEKTSLHAVGWTPTFAPTKLSEQTGIKQLWVKDESRNPTASFKDRASALLVVRAAEIDAEITVTASTGNAGAALAGMAAATGRKAVIFAPKTAPPAKIAQLLIFGAKVVLVDGTYDDAFDLSVETTKEFGWYNRNTGYNPFTAEGKKTAAFEIWEQVILQQDLDRPLCVFVSVGDGNIISGLHKGFKDLHALGWLEHMPRIFGVQSEGSAAIYNAYAAGTEEIKAVSATTLADSISVDLPRDGLRALRAATQTNGAYIQVSDEAIISAIADLGPVGVFAEPAGSTAYAGVQKALEDGQITMDDPVLALNTGSGLKDVKAAMQAAGEAPIIKPDLDAVKELLN